MIKTFVAKPIIKTGIKYDGKNEKEIKKFVGKNLVAKGKKLYIHTMEGDMELKKGSYAMKGVKGEFYPCDPDVIKQSYDEKEGDDIKETIYAVDPSNPSLGSTDDQINKIKSNSSYDAKKDDIMVKEDKITKRGMLNILHERKMHKAGYIEERLTKKEFLNRRNR